MLRSSILDIDSFAFARMAFDADFQYLRVGCCGFLNGRLWSLSAFSSDRVPKLLYLIVLERRDKSPLPYLFKTWNPAYGLTSTRINRLN